MFKFQAQIRAYPCLRRTTRQGIIYYTKDYKNFYMKLTELLKEALSEDNCVAKEYATSYKVDVELGFRRPPTSKIPCPNADNDNLEKGVFDALVKAGVITDDRRIEINTTRKSWCECDCIYIEVIELN